MAKVSNFVLWGSAGHAKVLADIIALRGGRVIALFDNLDVTSALPGVPVFTGKEKFFRWVEDQDQLHEIAGFAAIGGVLGRDRMGIQALFRTQGLHEAVLVHPSAQVSPTARLGLGSQVLALANIAADAAALALLRDRPQVRRAGHGLAAEAESGGSA